MQTILLSEQDSEQIQSATSVSKHVDNLFLGLFLGLLVMILDRRRGGDQLPHRQRGTWWRSTLLFGGSIGLILLVILLLMGP